MNGDRSREPKRMEGGWNDEMGSSVNTESENERRWKTRSLYSSCAWYAGVCTSTVQYSFPIRSLYCSIWTGSVVATVHSFCMSCRWTVQWPSPYLPNQNMILFKNRSIYFWVIAISWIFYYFLYSVSMCRMSENRCLYRPVYKIIKMIRRWDFSIRDALRKT